MIENGWNAFSFHSYPIFIYTFRDNFQIQTLENLALAQEREIADNNNIIEEHQAYYEALRKKDYQALWERDEDKSAMSYTN